MVREIKLTQGQVAIVDDDDYPSLSRMKWCAWRPRKSKTFYAATGYRAAPGKWRTHLMHRLLAGFPEGMMVDHWDGNGLNNTRSNIRICTQQQNNQHGSHATRGISRFRGVTWNIAAGKWQAQIGVRARKKKYLGLFATEEEAALAYDAAARAEFGEFAYQNFPTE